MKVVVTGADGFVGRYLVDRLLAGEHEVVAGHHPAGHGAMANERARSVSLDVTDDASVRAALAGGFDAVVHLAAVASVRQANDSPGRAWEVNAAGTARLLDGVLRSGATDPVVLVVSTGEVYGAGEANVEPRPRVETDPLRPRSPYAASKAAAELAALEAHRRAGLRVVVARAFPHTGPGQTTQYVAPAFAARLLEAKRDGRPAVRVGNLAPVRDLLDVRDVAAAYVALLTSGEPGEIYNVARGEGLALAELFRLLAAAAGVAAEPEADPALARPADIPYLVGDAGKLRRATGWTPTIPLERTLRDLVNAQAQ